MLRLLFLCLLLLDSKASDVGARFKTSLLEDACAEATIVSNDWRSPAEDGGDNCDRNLDVSNWYKFMYHGAPAIIAPHPIPAKHCGTVGSISLSSKHSPHPYPPPINHSALYISCAHVLVMGVVACVQHLTVPVVARTCPNNEVIYFFPQLFTHCPSALCVTARDKPLDDFYILKPRATRKTYQNFENLVEVSDLTAFHQELVVSMEINATEKEFNKSTKNVLRSVLRSLRNNYWKKDACFSVKNISYKENCVNYSNKTTTTNNNVDERQRKIAFMNDSNIELSSSFLFQPSDPLCHLTLQNIKRVHLKPLFHEGLYRASFYVVNFCGYVAASDLLSVLHWVNFTNSFLQGVHRIYKGLPKDQILKEELVSLSLNAGVWSMLFICLFLAICLLFFVLVCFRHKIKFAFNDQREKIILIDYDQTKRWILGEHGIGRVKNLRNGRSTLSSRSFEATKERHLSPQSSHIEQNFKDMLRKTFRGNETNKKFPFFIPSSICSRVYNSIADLLPTSRRSLPNKKNSSKSGWIVPLEEMEQLELKDSPVFSVPKMVVDQKKRTKQQNNENCIERSNV